MSYRFLIGDQVAVKRENPEGNPRTPAYVRGHNGVVTFIHGVIENTIDHHGVYPPLYTIGFNVQDLFGGECSDKIWVDVHEEWLEVTGRG